MNLSGKTAVITGISGGIGLAVAKELLAKNCIVFGLGRNQPDLKHPHLHFISCDIRKMNEVESAFHGIQLQTNSVDILINNAGLGYFGNLEEMPPDQWHELFDTNVNGIYYCCRSAIPLMKRQGSGHIINMASTAALEGMPQVSAYCATKWAVKGLSESLFRELRDYRIKVTCIYPGSTKTGFFKNSPNIKPHDYMLMPEDVAASIVYAIETPDNFHTVNLEIRPLQPKGPVKNQ